jgi:hypothetical protein
MHTGYGGAPAAPRSGMSCLAWAGIGCLILAVLVVIAIFIGVATFKGNPKVMEFSKSMSKMQQSESASVSCGQNMTEVRRALNAYRDAHHNNYPASLKDLSPKYMPAGTDVCSSAPGSTPINPVYTPPGKGSPDDAPVISYEAGNVSMFGVEQMTIYVRLLKNDKIVQDQVTRVELNLQGHKKGWQTEETKP